MIYLERLKHWWTIRWVRMYAVLAIEIGFIINVCLEPEIIFAWVAAIGFAVLNLAWSSRLNPAWRHQFRPDIKWICRNRWLYQAEHEGMIFTVLGNEKRGLYYNEWTFTVASHDDGERKLIASGKRDTMITAMAAATEWSRSTTK